MKSHRTPAIGGSIFATWFLACWRQRVVIYDHYPMYDGWEWGDMLKTFESHRSMTSPNRLQENGVADRAIALWEIEFTQIRPNNSNVGIARAMAWAGRPNNLFPMVCSALSPDKGTIGRNATMETLRNQQLIHRQESERRQHTMQTQLRNVIGSSLSANQRCTLSCAPKSSPLLPHEIN